jgi:hypothetical protein
MLSLLYRGSLTSCNYACGYCPFAKKRDTRATLARDAAEVARFTGWAAAQSRELRILFTPWGEAIVRRHYREAMHELARMPHVAQVSLQTNLSGPTTWLADVPPGKVSLWCTFHPDQTTLARFVERCTALAALGVRHSVGVVGLREHFDAIRALRAALPDSTPLWINPYDRRGPGYYTAEDLAWLDGIDPWFALGNAPPPSRGRPCAAGEDVVSVDGDGRVQRCHFIPVPLGNLYEDDLAAMLRPRACSRLKCECFIGYAHRKDLPLRQAFGSGLLTRVPIAAAGR